MDIFKFFKDKKEEAEPNSSTKKSFDEVSPKDIGKLDMVIAFDTTGSMARYIGDVRNQVTELIPRLFKDNKDLQLGIVAFGDYCDMESPDCYGAAYQALMLTNNENEIIRFIQESQNTSGGDGDEFYELVIKKIVEETPWREGSSRSVLLISDANPHELGYTYGEFVKGNQIDWRIEARKAAAKKIKFDTVSIHPLDWYKELSAMTNGINVPFRSVDKTGELIEARSYASGSYEARKKFDILAEECKDQEMKEVFRSLRKAREDFE